MTRQRGGFTLVELLVVIAIIGMLVALLLPAVQSARESARRVTCANHVRQLALGYLQHNQAQNVFPTGGWGWYWFGDADRGGSEQPGGWAFNILMFIEQGQIFDLCADGDPEQILSQQMEGAARAVQVALPVMFCPTRRSPGTFERYLPARFAANEYAHNADPAEREARNDYAANSGDNFVKWGSGPSAEDGMAGRGFRDMRLSTGISFQRSQIQSAHVRDGMSNTFLLGEKHVARQHYLDGVDTGDDQNYLTGDDWDLHRWTHKPPLRDRLDEIHQHTFGSAHAEGLNMAMADGSVHFVSYEIAPETFRYLGNRMDGQVVSVAN